MRTSARLGLYGGGLALLFAAAFGTASAVVPESAAEEWNEETGDMDMDMGDDSGHGDDHGEAAASVGGLAIEQDGYRLGAVSAPGQAGVAGTLAFAITAPDGEPLTDYTVSHEKDLHLIVVRSDGTRFRHEHPTLDEHGTWSLPWTWDVAGTYRVYADFVPADGASGVTLTRTVEVAGDYGPETPANTSTAEVDGYTVTLDGDLAAGTTSNVTAEITRDGEPVTALEPYLGAFGHLVALREGDLAYLHVHPEGDEPAPGDLSGPRIEFATEFPTEGRYFLYLDFQVDGQVRTAAFTVETTGAATEAEPDDPGTEPAPDDPGAEPTTDGHEHDGESASDGHGH